MTGELAMFPLGMVVFPHQVVGLCVFEDRYRRMLDELADESFGTCLIARGHEVGGDDERTEVGTLLRIVDSEEVPTGQVLLRAEGVARLRVREWLVDAPYPRALVIETRDREGVDVQLLQHAESAVRSLRSLQSEMHTEVSLKRECEMDDDPMVRAWQLCALTPMSALDQFRLLGLESMNERLRQLAEICCERYGDYQRMLALDEPVTLTD